MRRLRIALVRTAVAMAFALTMVAAAAADDAFSTTLSGFGTVGGTFTSNGAYAYRHDITEFSGATNRFDVGLESRLGVQAVFEFGSGFSVTAQEVARRRGSKDFDLDTEWLYVQYSPAPDWQFRVGRVVLATFLLSDSREVGYAAPWFRAPNEVYAGDPFNSSDGGQVLWRHNLGPAELKVQASYGNTKSSIQVFDNIISIKTNYVFNASASLEYENILLRVAQTKINSPITLPLSATFSVSYNVQDKFNTVGLQYDDGKAIVIGEWAKRSEPAGPGLPLPLAGSSQWYLAGGWRFGKLTPMLIYGVEKLDEGLLNHASSFGAWSANLRYDVIRNVALKVEISRTQAGNGVYWVAPNYASSERVNVYSFGADFVF